jgi:hypothetical protein
LSVLICFWIIGTYVDGFFLYSATNDKQSVFIQKYNPQRVLDTFASSEGEASGMSEGAGRKFVTTVRTMEPHLAIQPEKVTPLMNALRGDMSAQLIHNGAQILSQTGDPSSGFHFTYRLGKTLGSAIISPLIAKHWQYHTLQDGTRVPITPPDGSQEMAANIVISEKWFPKESTVLQASR